MTRYLMNRRTEKLKTDMLRVMPGCKHVTTGKGSFITHDRRVRPAKIGFFS